MTRTTTGPIVPDRAPAGSTRLVIIAAVMALAAIVVVNLYIEVVRRQSTTEPITRYRLTQNLRPGDRFNQRHVEPVQLPAEFESSFQNFLDQRAVESRYNQVVLRGGEENEFVTARLFTDVDSRDIAAEITQGMRLYTMRVTGDAIADLRPGMYVDLEVPFTTPGGIVVMPVMERVKVLTVGSFSMVDQKGAGGGRPTGSYRSVGVEVTPQAATKLAMVQLNGAGEFKMFLRNTGDAAPVKITNPDPDTLINPAVLALLPTAVPTAPGAAGAAASPAGGAANGAATTFNTR